MSETKWTPGPWMIDRGPDKYDFLGCKIAELPDSTILSALKRGPFETGGRWCDIWSADAYLIAAAPDMAEALRPFVEWAEFISEMYIFAPENDTDIAPKLFRKEITLGDLRRAREAYLKATGGKG